MAVIFLAQAHNLVPWPLCQLPPHGTCGNLMGVGASLGSIPLRPWDFAKGNMFAMQRPYEGCLLSPFAQR